MQHPPRRAKRQLQSALLSAVIISCAVGCGTESTQIDDPPVQLLPAQFPENSHLLWASNRSSNRHEIFMRKGSQGPVTQLTFEGGRAPRWSTQGDWIAYHRLSDATVRIMRRDGGEDHVACANISATDGPAYFWRQSDGFLICATSAMPSIPGRGLEFIAFNASTGVSETFAQQSDFVHVADIRFEPGAMTHDGKALIGWAFGLFSGGYEANNGTFDSYHSTVLLYLDRPGEIYHIGAGCLSATGPSEPWIYHVSRETNTVPDVFRVRADDLMQRQSYEVEIGLADEAWGHEYMPDISNDGLWMVYGASQGCHNWYSCDYEIFAHRLGEAADSRIRLTHNLANDSFPSLFVDEP